MRSNSDLGKLSFLRKYLTFFIAVFGFLSSFGNNVIQEINQLGEIEFIHINKIDTPRLNTSYIDFLTLNIDKAYDLKRLHLIFPINDDTCVSVALINGESRHYEAGLIHSNNKIAYDWQVGLIVIDLEDVDLDKAIEIEITPRTIIGKAQINEKIGIVAFEGNTLNGQSYLDFEKWESVKSFLYHLLLGMIIISFVYFLMHYFVMKHKHFLFYSIYLFFLIFNYGYRTPFLYHIYNPIDPSLYIFIDINSQMFAFLGYLLFLVKFLNVDVKFDKFKFWYKLTIGLFGFIIIIDNGLLLYSISTESIISYDSILISIKAVLILIGMGFVFYMVRKKGYYQIKSIVTLLGSFLLLVGYALCIVFKSYMTIMVIVVLETIIFMGVISYLHITRYKNMLDSQKAEEEAKQRSLTKELENKTLRVEQERLEIEKNKIKELKEYNERVSGNISHDIRTPLCNMQMIFETLLVSTKIDKNSQKMIKIMKSALYRSISNTNDLVDILSNGAKQQQTLKISEGNPLELIESIAREFEFNAENKNINYDIIIQSEQPEAWFDWKMVDRIIYELLNNAFKQVPDEGDVICTSTIQNNEIKIKISNTADEMIKADLPKIFKPLYQKNKEDDGFGIGLSVVKELVSLHKGTIEVILKDKRITFLVNLPVDKKDFSSEEIIQIESKNDITLSFENVEIPSGKEKVTKDKTKRPLILLVDDDEKHLSILKGLLYKDYKLKTANNGEDGFKLALENMPDIVITDRHMPKKCGLTLTSELHENLITNHIPVIMFSGSNFSDTRSKSIESGALNYFHKGNGEIKDLKTLINKILEKKKRPSDLLRGKSIFDIDAEQLENSGESELIKKLQEALKKNLSDPLFKASQLAEVLKMSLRQLQRKFEKTSILSDLRPQKLLINERMYMAPKVLLENSDKTIEWLINNNKLGYKDQSSFSNAFKLFYKITPVDFRKNRK